MPQSIEEAYQILTAKNTNCILGGCAWLRLGRRRIHTAVDLSACGLDFIREDGSQVEIGAMASYRKVETDPIILHNFSGALSRAVAPIIGTQFRNTVTVGGSVFSRFGFSDFLTPLLALDTSVVLHADGTVPLETFMNMPYKKDILEKVVIRKNGADLSYQMLRNAEADFPIVNLAAAKNADTVKITVGARSGRAVTAAETSAYLTEHKDDLCDSSIQKQAAALLEKEVRFTSNMRASAVYRAEMAKVLLRRALEEVSGC